MTRFLRSTAFLGVLLFASAPAWADSLNVQWFTLASGDHDADPNVCKGPLPDMVQSALGPDGLPVFNTSAVCLGSSTAPTDLNSSGELLWWTPGTAPTGDPNVTATGTGTLSMPIERLNPSTNNMAPPNGTGTSDQNGFFQTAILSGFLSVPISESVTFTLGSDDDSFLFINGQSVGQQGGIQILSDATFTTPTLGPGLYPLLLFYSDRAPAGAQLDFSIDTPGVHVDPTPTPEPASMALLGSGLLGVVGMLRRKASRKA